MGVSKLDDPELKQALIKGYENINEQAVEVHRLIRDMGFAQLFFGRYKLKLSALRFFPRGLK